MKNLLYRFSDPSGRFLYHSQNVENQATSPEITEQSSDEALLGVLDGKLLKSGQSEATKALQILLTRKKEAVLEADGIYGSATTAAVRAFQEAHGLEVDGIFGAKTYEALRQSLQAQEAQKTIQETQLDLEDAKQFISENMDRHTKALKLQGAVWNLVRGNKETIENSKTNMAKNEKNEIDETSPEYQYYGNRLEGALEALKDANEGDLIEGGLFGNFRNAMLEIMNVGDNLERELRKAGFTDEAEIARVRANLSAAPRTVEANKKAFENHFPNGIKQFAEENYHQKDVQLLARDLIAFFVFGKLPLGHLKTPFWSRVEKGPDTDAISRAVASHVLIDFYRDEPEFAGKSDDEIIAAIQNDETGKYGMLDATQKTNTALGERVSEAQDIARGGTDYERFVRGDITDEDVAYQGELLTTQANHIKDVLTTYGIEINNNEKVTFHKAKLTEHFFWKGFLGTERILDGKDRRSFKKLRKEALKSDDSKVVVENLRKMLEIAEKEMIEDFYPNKESRKIAEEKGYFGEEGLKPWREQIIDLGHVNWETEQAFGGGTDHHTARVYAIRIQEKEQQNPRYKMFYKEYTGKKDADFTFDSEKEGTLTQAEVEAKGLQYIRGELGGTPLRDRLRTKARYLNIYNGVLIEDSQADVQLSQLRELRTLHSELDMYVSNKEQMAELHGLNSLEGDESAKENIKQNARYFAASDLFVTLLRDPKNQLKEEPQALEALRNVHIKNEDQIDRVLRDLATNEEVMVWLADRIADGTVQPTDWKHELGSLYTDSTFPVKRRLMLYIDAHKGFFEQRNTGRKSRSAEESAPDGSTTETFDPIKDAANPLESALIEDGSGAVVEEVASGVVEGVVEDGADGVITEGFKSTVGG